MALCRYKTKNGPNSFRGPNEENRPKSAKSPLLVVVLLKKKVNCQRGMTRKTYAKI